jgi:hypothetical protein
MFWVLHDLGMGSKITTSFPEKALYLIFGDLRSSQLGYRMHLSCIELAISPCSLFAEEGRKLSRSVSELLHRSEYSSVLLCPRSGNAAKRGAPRFRFPFRL